MMKMTFLSPGKRVLRGFHFRDPIFITFHLTLSETHFGPFPFHSDHFHLSNVKSDEYTKPLENVFLKYFVLAQTGAQGMEMS